MKKLLCLILIHYIFSIFDVYADTIAVFPIPGFPTSTADFSGVKSTNITFFISSNSVIDVLLMFFYVVSLFANLYAVLYGSPSLSKSRGNARAQLT